jgi:hypothetical protein
MTQQEIQERNKQIALMLGGVYDTDMTEFWFYLPKGIKWSGIFAPTTSDLSFHSDWNWLHEAVEFIEKLKNISLYIGKNKMSKTHSVEISYEDYSWEKKPHRDKTIFIQNESKKEAVFIAVSDFAKLYNNKEL